MGISSEEKQKWHDQGQKDGASGNTDVLHENGPGFFDNLWSSKEEAQERRGAYNSGVENAEKQK